MTFCASCGAEADPSDLFCANCGTKLNGGKPQAQNLVDRTQSVGTLALLRNARPLNLQNGEKIILVLGPDPSSEEGALLFATNRRVLWVKPEFLPAANSRTLKDIPYDDVTVISVRRANETLPPNPEDVRFYFSFGEQVRFDFRAADCYGFSESGTPYWVPPILARAALVHWLIVMRQQSVKGREWSKKRWTVIKSAVGMGGEEENFGVLSGMIRPQGYPQFQYGSVMLTSERLAFLAYGQTRAIGVKLYGNELLEYEDDLQVRVLKTLPLADVYLAEDPVSKADKNGNPMMVFSGMDAFQPLYINKEVMDRFVRQLHEKSEELAVWEAWQEAQSKFHWFYEAHVFDSSKPLRIPIQEVFSRPDSHSMGVDLVGRIESGKVKVGERVVAMPERAYAKVMTIRVRQEDTFADETEGTAGEVVTLGLAREGSQALVRGSVIGPADSPPNTAVEIGGRMWVLLPGASADPVTLYAHAARVDAVISQAISSSELESQSELPIGGRPKTLYAGEYPSVTISFSRPIPFENFGEFPALGWFALRHNEDIISVGIVGERLKERFLDVSIRNVVANGSIHQAVDLNWIVKNFADAEYNDPQRLQMGVVFRLAKYGTSTLMFGSGNMVCTGAKSEIHAKQSIEEVVKRLRDRGMLIRNDVEVQIHSVIASTTFAGPIEIDAIPSLFPTEFLPGHVRVVPPSLYLKREGSTVRCIYNDGNSISNLSSEEEITRALTAIRGLKEDNIKYLSSDLAERGYVLCRTENGCTLLLFKTGYAVLESAKSEVEARQTLNRLEEPARWKMFTLISSISSNVLPDAEMRGDLQESKEEPPRPPMEQAQGMPPTVSDTAVQKASPP